MTKLLVLATALTLALASFVSTAQAGMRVGIGVGGLAIGAIGAIANSGRSSEAREYRERRKPRAARRESEEKAPTRTAKKSKSEKSETTEEAKSETPATTEASSIAAAEGATPVAPVTTGSMTAVSGIEHSSIALASADERPMAKKVDTASDNSTGLGCKKFFPSVGMTLSVPCE